MIEEPTPEDVIEWLRRQIGRTDVLAVMAEHTMLLTRMVDFRVKQLLANKSIDVDTSVGVVPVHEYKKQM
jgi:hypothetical protein